MNTKKVALLSLLVLIVAMATVSAADSDNSATTDNSGSDVAVDSSSSTSQATDTSTHTDSSVDKTSDASTTSSQKTDTTSQQTTQKVSDKTSENTQTTSDTTAKASSDTTSKASSDTSSQSTQSTSQSTQQVQSDSNTTNENTNTVNEKTVDSSKTISTADDVSSELDATVWNVTDLVSFTEAYFKSNSGDTINIEGSFNGAILSIEKSLTITSFSTANITSITFNMLPGSSGSTISNLYIDNSNTGREAVNVTEGVTDVTITNNTFVMNSASIYGKAFTVNSTNNVNITNNNIMMNNLKLNDTYAIGVFDSSDVIISNNSIKINTSISLGKGIIIKNSSNINILNNNISVSAVTKNINYVHDDENITWEGTVDTYGVGVFNSSYVTVSDNVIQVKNSVNNSNNYSTITGIAVQGSDLYSSKVTDTSITYNNISIENEGYAYGITINYNVDDSYIAFNNISSISGTDYYDCGISVTGSNNRTRIFYNNINLNSSELSYGIILTGSALRNSIRNDASNNNITLSSNAARGIECYCIYNMMGYSNKITVNGNYTNGIGIGGCYSCDLMWNSIETNGLNSNQYEGYESVPIITSGIYVINTTAWYGSTPYDYNSTNIYIMRSNITTSGDYSINLTANDCIIRNNNLTSNSTGTKLHGENSILVNGENNIVTSNSASKEQGYEQTDDDDEPLTHNITQDNYDKYFREATSDTPAGLTDIVNDGDVLNLQGDINVTYQLVIDKAVNLTSLDNTGRLVGDGDNHRRLTIITSGSNTNVTNITVYNMEFFTENAHNITIDHINVTNIGINGLGEDTGVTSIRNDSENITIKNSYFYTENNGGHSTLVSAGASYITIDNCTVQGVGTVGNIVYLTTYNVGQGAVNGHINITNNIIIGPEESSAICWALAIGGDDVIVANNFVNYTGQGITGQWGTVDFGNNYCYNNTVVGTGIGLVGADVINNTAEYVGTTNGNVINNTVTSQLGIAGDNLIAVNNTITGENGTFNINTTNSFIENNTIENTNITLNETNNTFRYNQLTGNITYNINGENNIIANNPVQSSGLSDSMLIINGSNNIFENNSLYNVYNNITRLLNATFIISNNSNNNTIRYNDFIVYDALRGTYLAGDDCVYVTEGTSGNIVQDNYGNVSKIVIPTSETNYTYITYNVTSMSELISALDDIKANGTYSEDTKYVINLLDGDYTVTEAITWGDATSDVREVIINGTGQTINGNGFASTFLTIEDGYTFTFNNVTITNFVLSNSTNSILNNGNLTIYNSVLDNAGLIGSDGSVGYYTKFNTIMINNTNITQTAILGYGAIMNITNSIFYDTDLSSQSMALINNTYGNLTFLNNKVSNITSTNVIYAQSFYFLSLLSTNFIENNEFSDLHSTGLDLNVSNALYDANDVAGSFINNTFINGAKLNVSVVTGHGIMYNMNNHYINCSLPVNITNIQNATITTEDYTTTITVSADSSYGANVDGKITVIINDEEYKTYDVVNGESNITIENSALNIADNNIEIKYTSEDGSFENASTTFTITLAEDMIIRIPEGTLYSGDQITLTTQVAVNGSIAKDGYVIFKVNGKTVRDENGNPIMVQVDENGMASLNYTIPDTYSNEYNITAVYSGSEGIVRTNTTLTTTLKTATITVDQITAKAGQTVTLRAYITDQNGNAVSSGKLIFKLNGKTLKDANGNTLYATINNGLATLVYTIPDNYSAKDYILTAVYQGTGFERAEANSTLTLTKSTPTIIPDSTVFGSDNKITITQGTESVQIKATINDPETNAPIDTTTVVTIKINDKTVTQQYVSDGQIDMTIYTASFANPTYNITVVVGENSQYERTSFNGTLEIVTLNGLATSSSYNGTLLVKEE